VEPVDPWGERDEYGVLYRLATGGDDNPAQGVFQIKSSPE
jgi:hypothetical protein